MPRRSPQLHRCGFPPSNPTSTRLATCCSCVCACACAHCSQWLTFHLSFAVLHVFLSYAIFRHMHSSHMHAGAHRKATANVGQDAQGISVELHVCAPAGARVPGGRIDELRIDELKLLHARLHLSFSQPPSLRCSDQRMPVHACERGRGKERGCKVCERERGADGFCGHERHKERPQSG